MTNEEAIQTIRDEIDFLEEEYENEAHDFIEALRLAISALSRDRWISDRPPLQDEATGYVLAVVDGECGNITFDGALVLAEYDPPYGEWLVDAYPDGIFKVKAWRPLPEPPKEDKP